MIQLDLTPQKNVGLKHCNSLVIYVISWYGGPDLPRHVAGLCNDAFPRAILVSVEYRQLVPGLDLSTHPGTAWVQPLLILTLSAKSQNLGNYGQ